MKKKLVVKYVVSYWSDSLNKRVERKFDNEQDMIIAKYKMESRGRESIREEKRVCSK
jgi:hypothetical protein